jgi:hypothetical protein
LLVVLVVWVTPEEGARFEGSGLAEEWGEGDAVGFVVRAVGDGGDVEGVEVGADRGGVGSRAGAGDAGPVDDEPAARKASAIVGSSRGRCLVQSGTRSLGLTGIMPGIQSVTWRRAGYLPVRMQARVGEQTVQAE